MISVDIKLSRPAPAVQRGRWRGFAALRALAIFTLATWLAPAAAATDLLSRASAALDAGNPKAAMQLLLPMQGDRAGEPKFDYLLGLAALRGARPDIALFAFERVLAVQPAYPGARLASARTYLALGERRIAMQELAAAERAGQVSAADKTAFQRQADEAVPESGARAASYSAYLELELGYDDNIASTTAENVIPTPTGVVLLSDDLVDRQDLFGKLRGGFRIAYPLSGRFALDARGNAVARFNESVGNNDFRGIDGQLGLSWRSGGTHVLAGAYAAKFHRDYRDHRDAYGPFLQVRQQLNPVDSLAGFVRTTRMNYKSRNDNRDALRVLGGATYTHRFAGAYSPIGYASVFAGANNPDDSIGDRYEYDLIGARIGGQLSLSPTLRPYASVAYRRASYDNAHPRFLNKRRDDRLRLTVGVRYSPAKFWTIQPEVSYQNNDSNIILNDYDRTMWSIRLRRDFN